MGQDPSYHPHIDVASCLESFKIKSYKRMKEKGTEMLKADRVKIGWSKLLECKPQNGLIGARVHSISNK